MTYSFYDDCPFLKHIDGIQSVNGRFPKLAGHKIPCSFCLEFLHRKRSAKYCSSPGHFYCRKHRNMVLDDMEYDLGYEFPVLSPEEEQHVEEIADEIMREVMCEWLRSNHRFR